MLQQRKFRATPSAQLRGLLGQLEACVGKMEHDSREVMQYDEAGRLADEVGDPEIAAIARVQKAFLYQQLFIPTSTAP